MRSDLQIFVDQLWAAVLTNAQGIDGAKVISVLRETTEILNEAGIDEAWDSADIKNRKQVYDAFCITWLTTLAAKLKEMTYVDRK